MFWSSNKNSRLGRGKEGKISFSQLLHRWFSQHLFRLIGNLCIYLRKICVNPINAKACANKNGLCGRISHNPLISHVGLAGIEPATV
jgi:hypothetical protein